jgi:ATP-binding cassette subfamily B multidrug efflux pump
MAEGRTMQRNNGGNGGTTRQTERPQMRIGPPGPGGPGGPRFHEVQKPKDAWGTLRRLWGYLERQRTTLVGTMLLVLATTGLELLGPYLQGIIVDSAIARGDLRELARLVGILIATNLVTAGAVWFQQYIMIGATQRVVRDLRDDLFAKLQTLSLRFFDQRAHGELMSRLTNDVENINMVLANTITQLMHSVLSVVGILAVMIAINIPLTLASLVTVPITVLLARAMTSYTRKRFREQQEHLGDLNGIIEETVTGHRVVKAFAQEEAVIRDFDGANRRLQRAATNAQTVAGFMGPLMNLLNNASLAIVAAAGGWMALHNMATVGTIVSFIGYSRRVSRPVNQLAQLFNSIQSALAGAERIFEIMDEVPDLVDAPDAHPLERIEGDVVFDDVSFGYEEGVPVLKHVSLHAVPGQMIALVGPTGAGKTTIANLLTRFYDVDEGAIRVDGRDIRHVLKDDLRRKLGLVLQDNFLFGDTVMANIRYGKPEATDEEVIAAARVANADHFVRHLPEGYQTVLTERGANLSQGQRQLLAIARAILADPDILILDEATSSVDTRTEKHLQEALLKLMEGRTSFVIAHRLSTIREADQVLVINHGEVIERGAHEELLSEGGFYEHLYSSQFKHQAAQARVCMIASDTAAG